MLTANDLIMTIVETLTYYFLIFCLIISILILLLQQIIPTPVGWLKFIPLECLCRTDISAVFLLNSFIMSVHKVAILIDGGFFLQRFKTTNNRSPRIADMGPFISAILNKVAATNTVGNSDMLLRTYYYDCRPNGDTKTDPNGTIVNFAHHAQFTAANNFHNDLRTFPQLARRLGELSLDGWKVSGNHNPPQYKPDFKQKSVDIKLGLDIAWMSSKRTIDKLVLVAGDSDFVAPMKFARREGILVYLYPMGQPQIKIILKEHADFIIT